MSKAINKAIDKYLSASALLRVATEALANADDKETNRVIYLPNKINKLALETEDAAARLMEIYGDRIRELENTVRELNDISVEVRP